MTRPVDGHTAGVYTRTMNTNKEAKMNTCQHFNADAMETAACGQSEAWVCTDCGAEFSVTHRHRLLRTTKHADDCTATGTRRAFHVCGCKITNIRICMDCMTEFPLDVDRERDDVEFYS